MPVRFGLAAVAVGVGLAAATGHNVAWADDGHADSSNHAVSHPSAGQTPAGPKRTASRPPHSKQSGVTPAAATVSGTFDGRKSVGAQPNLVLTHPGPAATTAAHVKVAALTTSVTPSPPGPLSPIAQIAALPGRVINAVLQTLDFTISASGPKSPFNFAPLDEALFAAFRRLEDAAGLSKIPTVQPVLLPQTYDGPTDAKTPTVAQFLNAASAEYVLGGTPGGLQPFTVNGVPMRSTNLLSGESAQVWVTPQQQIIIAYQGTTGGTNLLFNPLIAISQLVADTQVIFTHTTPQAFTDSLAFEQRVEAEAAEQGYSTSDLFVTGHSLGGWEAEYVAQQAGLSGIGFESPGINTVVAGNGANSGFVNIETYGDPAAYLATDLPGLQPFIPAYEAGGGSKPHYGSIVLIGNPDAVAPLLNSSALLGTGIVGDAVFMADFFGNFFEHHLPGMQAYNLGISLDPGVVPWLGATMGPVLAYGDMTIPKLKAVASQAGTLITP
jgi:hypothetical protein